jgi:hypothetical protein
MVVAQVSRAKHRRSWNNPRRGPRSLRVFSAYLGIDTTAGQLPAGRQLLLAQTSTPGTRRRASGRLHMFPRPRSRTRPLS